VDILAILDSDPMLVAELMQKVDQYYRESQIRPLKGFPVRSILECIPAVGDFPNIMGKLVIDFEKPNTLIRMIPSGPSVTFDQDSSYVITGGLGGLGQSLIQWMGDRGARNISILSRRDVTSVAGAQEFIESLAARLIQIDCLVCDISNKDQVMRVIRDISTERPIRGIVHAAVSYLDLTFEKVTGLRWYNGLSAKVMGTTNLHEATLSMPLDFFVMTTSALSVYAFPTQGAYTAANNFQDAFARYRRQLGLLASTVSMSLVQGASNVGANEATVNLFERNGAQLVDESQFLTLFEPAFLDNRTAIHAGLNQWLGRQVDPLSAANLHTYLDPVGMLASKQKDLGSPANTPRWHNDNRVCHIIRALSDAQQQSAHLEESLDKGGKGTAASIRKVYDAAIQRGDAERTSTVALVQDAITKAVADMLFVDVESIDPGKSVADLGVDSLIAAELRNWFLQALGYNISMLDLLDPTTSICVQAASITSKALDASV
jgi:NAD(P)-dependent dehydrogenase (short-subunit alcohol dehydrogenase family)/acyl carrier protein